jgi:hypothetical protein
MLKIHVPHAVAKLQVVTSRVQIDDEEYVVSKIDRGNEEVWLEPIAEWRARVAVQAYEPGEQMAGDIQDATTDMQRAKEVE